MIAPSAAKRVARMVAVAGLLTAIGCQQDPVGPVTTSDVQLEVLNDTLVLAQRVTELPDVFLQIVPPGTPASFEGLMQVRPPITLDLRLNSQVLIFG